MALPTEGRLGEWALDTKLMAKFCKQGPWHTDRKGRGRPSEGCYQASKPWALVMCPAQDRDGARFVAGHHLPRDSGSNGLV